MKGIIDFLINKDDLRAKLLRKMFVFMIIPMINVDGVFHGHFRMDTEGKNLNRYYIEPSLQKQYLFNYIVQPFMPLKNWRHILIIKIDYHSTLISMLIMQRKAISYTEML